MLNIAVLVSGGGTNLQALLDSEARGENPNGKITLVVASKPGVFALERAAKAGVEGCVVRRKDYAASEEFDAALLETLRAHKIDLVVLAGFLSVLGPSVIAAYPRRILNVHPALIPSFCGPGMYGLRPHEAALARGCKVTGGRLWQSTQSSWFCQGLSLWESWTRSGLRGRASLFFHSISPLHTIATALGSSFHSACSITRFCSTSGVSPGRISTAFCSRMGPPSHSSLTKCTVAPVTLQPRARAA